MQPIGKVSEESDRRYIVSAHLLRKVEVHKKIGLIFTKIIVPASLTANEETAQKGRLIALRGVRSTGLEAVESLTLVCL